MCFWGNVYPYLFDTESFHPKIIVTKRGIMLFFFNLLLMTLLCLVVPMLINYLVL
jgi:hypothetical protein